MSEIRMVVGLGNPGKEYAGTRHNVGFRVIDSLGEALGIEVRKKKFGGVFGQGEFKDKKLILLKPWQFMNRSGEAVATAAGFYKLDRSDVLVVSDDMDIEPGKIRIRAKGSCGGQKGLGDVIAKLGSNEVGRLRIGIGRSEFMGDVDFVLGRATKTEQPLLDEAIATACKAVLYWIENGIENTMNEFN